MGVYGDYKPNPRWAGFLEEYSDALGLSIYIAAEGHEDDGKYVVESLDASDPYKSVDVVVAAGRGGRFERALESYRAIESSLVEGGEGTAAEQPQLTENDDEGESSMELKDIQELVEKALAEALSPVLEAITPAEAPEVEEVDFAAVVEAAVEADLPKESREAVVESVRAGANADEAIAKQVALVKAIESSFESKAERVVEGVVTAGEAPKFSLASLGGAR